MDKFEELVPVQDPCWHCKYLLKYNTDTPKILGVNLGAFFNLDFLIHFA